MLYPGRHFQTFLDSIYTDSPLKIVETGCQRDLGCASEFSDGWSTTYIARWVKEHGGDFHSVDLDIGAIELAHQALEAEGLAQFCTFHCQDSLKFLAAQSWIDFAFLDSADGLEHGLREWELSMSAGADLIVMDDFSTKAARAWDKAKELKWDCRAVDRYVVMRRPK